MTFNLGPVVAIGSLFYGITGIVRMWKFGHRTESVLWVAGFVAVGSCLPAILELKAESMWAIGALAVTKVSLCFCWVLSGYFINHRVRSLTQEDGTKKLQAYLDAGLKDGNRQKSS